MIAVSLMSPLVRSQNTLLCEIIKAWNPQPNILMSFIASNHMQPNWNDTPLPQGEFFRRSRLRPSLQPAPVQYVGEAWWM